MKRPILSFCLFILLGLAACQGDNRAIGSSCTEKDQCESGYCIQEERWGESTGWKDGYCTETCSGSCSGRAVCVPLGDDSFCLENCNADGDCRSGYVCNPYINACLPDCRRGWDCGSGFSCNDSGYCVISSAGQAWSRSFQPPLPVEMP
jgi:hypothetical protein